MDQSSCLTLVPAAVERSRTNRFAGTSLCTGTSASHFLPRADDKGTVRVEIGSKDAEDGDAVSKFDNLDPTRLVTVIWIPCFLGAHRGAAVVVEQSRKDANDALDL